MLQCFLNPPWNGAACAASSSRQEEIACLDFSLLYPELLDGIQGLLQNHGCARATRPRTRSSAPTGNWRANIIPTSARKRMPRFVSRNWAKPMKFSRTRKNGPLTTSSARTGRQTRNFARRRAGTRVSSFRGKGFRRAVTHRSTATFSNHCSARLFARARWRPRRGSWRSWRPARRRAAFHHPGEDHYAKVMIDLEDSYTGATRAITLQVPEVNAQGHVSTREHRLNVAIPKGIRAKQQIRLAGQGAPGHGQGKRGDLYLEIEFRPHPHLSCRWRRCVSRSAGCAVGGRVGRNGQNAHPGRNRGAQDTR